VRDSVGDVLRANAGAEHCHTCVARLVHSTFEHVAKAVTALRMTSRYRVTTLAVCCGCGHERTTVHAELPPR
jgi:hypothetical protein